MSARRLLLVMFSGMVLALGLGIPATASADPPNVTPSPSSVDFGATSVYQSTPSAEIQFENTTASPIEVYGFNVTGLDASQFQVGSDGCFAQTLNQNERCSVYLYLQPSMVGIFSASADLNTDQGVEAVPLAGEGAAGTLTGMSPTFTPQPYFYGSQYGSAQYQNSDPNFTVEGYNATITGPDAAFFAVSYNNCNAATLWPGSGCNVDVYFNPTGPGTKNAQLNLFNSGDPNPSTVPLSATALAGPMAALSPQDFEFGNVALGSSSASQQLTVTNVGDFTLQIQQIFVIGSSANEFPLSNNNCDGNQIAASASCTVDIEFSPGDAGLGNQSGTLFIITNSPGPVTQGTLHGVGYETPEGYLTLGGRAMALRTMACETNDFPAGTDLEFSWFRGNKQVGSKRKHKVADSDVGHRLSCSVKASNPVGEATFKSGKSPVVVPADLTNMPGGLVGTRVCRSIQAPPRIGPGRVSYGIPVTPANPILIEGKGEVTVKLDGKKLGSGKGSLKIPPRQIQSFSDGGHTLSIAAGGQVGQAQIALSGCQLAARSVLSGRRSMFKASSSAGMKQVVIKATAGSHFSPGRATGRFRFKSLRTPGEVFLLAGKRTTSNGVSVKVFKKKIQIKGLPDNTGVVRLNLGRQSFTGSKLEFVATLKSNGTRQVRISAARRQA